MSNQLIMGWNQLAATLLDWHTDPGNDTRRFAIFQIAIHDALNHIKPVYHKWKKRPSITINSTLVQQEVLDAAVNAAAATTLRMAISNPYRYGRWRHFDVRGCVSFLSLETDNGNKQEQPNSQMGAFKENTQCAGIPFNPCHPR